MHFATLKKGPLGMVEHSKRQVTHAAFHSPMTETSIGPVQQLGHLKHGAVQAGSAGLELAISARCGVTVITVGVVKQVT